MTKIESNNNTFYTGIDNNAWLQNIALGDHERLGPAPKGHLLLRATDTSPYARKVRIVADLLGLSNQVIMTPASFTPTNNCLNALNPLGKVPTVETDNGEVFFESTIINRYLCSLTQNHTLAEEILPTSNEAALKNAQIEAVADGITNAALAVVMEGRVHAPEAVSQDWVDRQNGKVQRCLHFLSENIQAQPIRSSGCIALACALGYLDWRGPSFRKDYPALEIWLATFEKAVPAYKATRAS